MGKHDARITETASRFADLCADLHENITVGGVILKTCAQHCCGTVPLFDLHSYYIQ